MNTLAIFEPKEHYLTTVYRNGRRNAKRIRIKSVDQLERLVKMQPKDKFLERKGIDCVIVDSTNKGFHLYVMIPPTNFRKFGDESIEEPSLFFKCYVSELLNLRSFKLISLDEVNYNASLDGNIRVIGSIHPKTGQVVYIKQGEFHDINENLDYYENAMHYHTQVVRVAYNKYCEQLEEIETKRLQYANRVKTEDDLLSLDLRDVFQSIFSLQKVRKYGNTIWCCCPFHNDENPSFCITPTHFFCSSSSCNEKGNIFTLIKKGLVEQPKQEYWITSKAQEKIKEN